MSLDSPKSGAGKFISCMKPGSYYLGLEPIHKTQRHTEAR